MINKLITTLLDPDMGEYALNLYKALLSSELSLHMFSELIITLHRASLNTFYEIEDTDFGDLSDRYQYLDPGCLCDYGASFALLCLKKIIKDNKAAKQDAVVTMGNCSLNIHELLNRINLATEAIGDEDNIAKDLVNQLDAFISWMPDNDDDLRYELLDIIDSDNSTLVYGLCTEYEKALSLEILKENQRKNPEDFFTFSDIREYHAMCTHTTFCYFFLEQASTIENERVLCARGEAYNAQTLKELIFYITEEDVYLDNGITFPYTVYRFLTDQTYDVQLKKEPTAQEIFDDGRDIPEELKDVFASAKSGNADAQSQLASRYQYGSNLPKDEHRAVFWLKLAAEGGDPFSQTNYGIALQNGMGGLERNYQEAIKWFLKAAEQGQHVAEYNLGLAYARGLGVERSLPEAYKWLKLSADGGHIMAQIMLNNGLLFDG